MTVIAGTEDTCRAFEIHNLQKLMTNFQRTFGNLVFNR